MEWVETTAKTVEAAKDAALDRLGVAADEAEFEVLEEPRPGLFGRTRGEERVRARVQPAQVRHQRIECSVHRLAVGDAAAMRADAFRQIGFAAVPGAGDACAGFR